jgi:thymidylate synthase (FAD)
MADVTFVHCTPDAERLIVQMARVSNPENADNWDTGPRLLRYLIKHRHWSPFQLASLCVRIDTERDIAAQILRHQSFSFQEFSTRYARTTVAECPPQRLQDTANRQNSFDTITEAGKREWDQLTARLISESYRLYDEMLKAGLAKETARRILPLCTPTTLYMHGSLRSWIHYLEVRTAVDTQHEHRVIAESCKQIFAEQFPVITDALRWS